MVKITNLQIAEMLMERGRASYSEMAKKFRVTEAAVRKRVKTLEKEGVIRGYSADIDMKKVGLNFHVMVGVDAKPEEYVSVMEKLRANSEVRSLYSSSGDHMMLAEAWFKDSRGLAKFMHGIEKMEGVTKVCPAIVMERLK